MRHTYYTHISLFILLIATCLKKGLDVMFNICQKCGQYRVDKIIDKQRQNAICPECRHPHRFKMLPLFILTGASGCGKSTMAIELSRIQEKVVVIENDIFWREEFHKSNDDFLEFREFCLRAAKNISQANRPVILCGSGVPHQYDICLERRYFGDMHYLGLVCDDNLLEKRLIERPEYRRSGSNEFITKQKIYNQYLKDLAFYKNEIDVLDTTQLSKEETAMEILKWINSKYIENTESVN